MKILRDFRQALRNGDDPALDGLPALPMALYGAGVVAAVYFLAGEWLECWMIVAFAVAACAARVFTRIAAWIYPPAVVWSGFCLIHWTLDLVASWVAE